MEGGAVTKSSFLYRLLNVEGVDLPKDDTQRNIQPNIKFSKETTTAKDIEDVVYHATPMYTVPQIKVPSGVNISRITVSDAISDAIKTNNGSAGLPPVCKRNASKKMSNEVSYAQIAVSSKSEDSRITGGGGKEYNNVKSTSNIDCNSSKNLETKSSFKKTNEVQTRKVSFKIKNTSASHKRSSLAGKTTVTITSNKVAELTRKYNEMVQDKGSTIHQPKFTKTIEKIQQFSNKSLSNSSTPSSTLSSGASIRIIVRQKRSAKSKNTRKRCSSVNSIDKIVCAESPIPKKKVFRTKSDGHRKNKSQRKKHTYPSIDKPNELDVVDGISNFDDKQTESISSVNSNVKNTIKKFECEINASKVDIREESVAKSDTQKTASMKPKVPEKKSSLFVTKNVVLKDGVPKIKTMNTITRDPSKGNDKFNEEINTCGHNALANKDSIRDKNKYKTSYIHRDKLTLKLVDIIQEDVSEDSVFNEGLEQPDNKDRIYQDIAARITPNDSFLWRRKSSCLSNSDLENSMDSCYDSPVIQISSQCHIDKNDLKNIIPQNATSGMSEHSSVNESRFYIDSSISETNSILDLESNAIEALNETTIIRNLTKPTLALPEDDYEPFAIVDEMAPVVVTEPVRTGIERQSSKWNCPLPDIPKAPLQTVKSGNANENVYQCLMEMRSHPEGDDSSVHSYELCENTLEERTRGDGDSDDGYEYCKSPPDAQTSLAKTESISKPLSDPKPLPPPPVESTTRNHTNYEISKSVSAASTESYEKIGNAIYEKIKTRQPALKVLPQLPVGTRDSIVSSEYAGYNDGENIYDTIKQPDGASISNCYESIPNSPSVVKLRNNFRKQLASAVQKRLSFDSLSNISRSTLSSEQKTNSIYGQRSMISFSGQEIAFPVPNSDSSVSDRSDRSEDWVDVSDHEEERQGDSKIIIVRERSRKSPISWSQKVRHQWQKSPKPKTVFITSPSSVYVGTCDKSGHYSDNDDAVRRLRDEGEVEATQHFLVVKTVAWDADGELQDLCVLIEAESSDSSHYYESLNGADDARGPRLPPAPYDDDFDSFDSDSDTETAQTDKVGGAGGGCPGDATLEHTRLPEPPPTAAHYTLTKFASVARRVAGKKMRELTRNFTKRHSDYGSTYEKTSPSNDKESTKQKTKSMIYETFGKITSSREKEPRIYGNIPSPDQKIYSPCSNPSYKTETPQMRLNGNALNDELKERINEKRLSTSNADVPPPLPDKPMTPTAEQGKGKDSGTLSRKTYFSFKSRFRRASSMALDINSEVPSALKITNSTFYLTDSMDGDSGFSNCSDSGQVNGGSAETLQSLALARKPRADSGTRRHSLHPKPKYESSPDLVASRAATASDERHLARLERPTAPPPPPPTDLSAVNEELKRLLPSLSRKDKSPRTRTSWYAECGQHDLEAAPSSAAPATPAAAAASSWYAEAGLYQESHVSSSSGASSSASSASSASPLPQHSRFTSEPLYQFYNAAKVESVCRENVADSDSDGYETVNEIKRQVERTSMAAAWLLSSRGPSRTLWCELPEVHNSALLNGLTATQKQLQEAKFELLTSEASYLNSLRVLETHFIGHPAFRDETVISRTDYGILFGDIIPVRKCSQLLMGELERCWQDNILLRGLCDVVRKHAEKHFRVYVKYCENQIFLVKTLQRLKAKAQFAEALTRLEAHASCQSLSLHSFLMLPMQRVTRLPLLLDAVLRHLDPADDEYQACMDTLATLNDFVSQCNEGARNMERVEEMCRLAAWLEFPAHMRAAGAPDLAPACSRRDARPARWLVRSGELTQLVWRGDEQLKLTFGKKFQKVSLWLFLFTDLLVITKKRSEESYTVVDYCRRSLVEISSGDVMTQLNMKETPGKHVVLLTLLENHENKTVEMLMSCASETDASRWREATAPPGAGAGGECVYAGWDCPQVTVLYAYTPTQPDELALAEGDIVNVLRKMPEGWYYGERIRDCETGWFPGSYTVEVASPHVRARNLRTRYRLLALSGSYLGQRKKT